MFWVFPVRHKKKLNENNCCASRFFPQAILGLDSLEFFFLIDLLLSLLSPHSFMYTCR